MTPEQFKKELERIRRESAEFTDRLAPIVAGTVAVNEFKRNLQTESFDGQKWKEVQRRIPGTLPLICQKYNLK